MTLSLTAMAERAGITPNELRGRMVAAGIAPHDHGAAWESRVRGFISELEASRRIPDSEEVWSALCRACGTGQAAHLRYVREAVIGRLRADGFLTGAT